MKAIACAIMVLSLTTAPFPSTGRGQTLVAVLTVSFTALTVVFLFAE